MNFPGTASDPVTDVTRVEVKIDNGNWNLATGTDNWYYSWDTHSIDEGSHLIYARSEDQFGAYSEIASVGVTVHFVPDLDCDGSLTWTSKRGATVTGTFTVSNIGETKSNLNWKVASYPNDWGTWSFSPRTNY